MSEKLFLTDIQTLRRRARQHMDDGAAKDDGSVYRETILKLLNNALANELICVQRNQRHRLLAPGTHAQQSQDFDLHGQKEQQHTDLIAARIVQLGGEPDFSLDGLESVSQERNVDAKSFVDLIPEDMIAECITMDWYREFIAYIGDEDILTRRAMEGILATEQQHAHVMANILEGSSA